MTGRPYQEDNTFEAREPIEDTHAWAIQQAAHLRAGRLDRVDALAVADEIDDVAHSEYDKLESALTVLLQHILKWDFQPERRSRSWELTIEEQRFRIARQLRKNPSLRPKRSEIIKDAFESAKRRAYIETKLARNTFPPLCPYDWDTMMERPFVADEP